jgi:hypothetical protein
VLPIVEQAAGPAPTAADDAADTVSERGVR